MVGDKVIEPWDGTITTALQVGEYRWEGLVFLALDGGDRWVRADLITNLERLPVDGPGNRTRIHLANRAKVTVPETIEEIFVMLQDVMQKVGA